MTSSRSFTTYLASLGLAQLATSFQIVLFQALILAATPSGRTLSLVLMAAATPRALLATLGGRMADRVGLGTILGATNLAKAAIVLALAASLWLSPPGLWGIAAAAILLGIADAFFYPATLTAVPALVEPQGRSRANALAQGTNQTMALLGPSAAGLAVTYLGILATLLVQALSLVFASLPLRWVHFHRSSDAPLDAGVARDERVARIMRQNGIFPPLAIIASVNLFFLGPHNIGTALLAQRYDQPAFVFGILLGSFGGGALAGSLLGAAFSLHAGYQRLTRFLPLFFAGGLAALFFAESLAVMVALRFALATVAALANIALLTEIQNRSPERWRGRVMGWVALAAVTALPLSYLFTALVPPGTPAESLFLAAAAPLAFIGLIVAALPPRAAATGSPGP